MWCNTVNFCPTTPMRIEDYTGWSKRLFFPPNINFSSDHSGHCRAVEKQVSIHPFNPSSSITVSSIKLGWLRNQSQAAQGTVPTGNYSSANCKRRSDELLSSVPIFTITAEQSEQETWRCSNDLRSESLLLFCVVVQIMPVQSEWVDMQHLPLTQAVPG